MGIDLEDPAVKPLLSDLQGNIFKPHGRQHSAYLFVTFRSDQSQAIRDWIRRFATFHVTTAEDQIKDARRYRELGLDAGLFINFFLSAKGYEVLGFREDQIPSDKGDKYAKGMKKAARRSRIPRPRSGRRAIRTRFTPSSSWPTLTSTALDRALTRFTGQLQPLTGKLTVEYGVRWFGPDGKQDIEPFGFADGISQPLFLTDEIDQAQQGGIDRWDPSAPLNLVLVKDPNGVGEDSYGSFFVFRKLEQDVAGFHQRLAELAQALGTDTKLAGAYVVGRFQDGTPVELHDHELGAETQDYVTNFNYADDMEGSRCPFHAHIRKTNPRGDTVRGLRGRLQIRAEPPHRAPRRPLREAATARNDSYLAGRPPLHLLPERHREPVRAHANVVGEQPPIRAPEDRARPDHRSGRATDRRPGVAVEIRRRLDSQGRPIRLLPIRQAQRWRVLLRPEPRVPHQSVTGRSGRWRAIRSSAGPSESSPCGEHSCSVSWS